MRCIDVAPDDCVGDDVAPSAAAEAGLTQETFATEPALLERPLLGHVVGFGVSAHAVHERGVEQVTDEQALRSRTGASPSVLGGQQDPVSQAQPCRPKRFGSSHMTQPRTVPSALATTS
ncbi:MAG TPA: hypothetical protein VK306_11875 [Acidimicrobiales bacterium]|nr:hypothetical protein [Acidimicrobiales bacterium]